MPNRFGTVVAFAFGVLAGAILAAEVVSASYDEDADVVGYRMPRAELAPATRGDGAPGVFLGDGGFAAAAAGPVTRTFTAGEDNVELYCNHAHTIHCSCPVEAFLP